MGCSGVSLEDQNTERDAGSRGLPPETAEGEGHVLGAGAIPEREH